MQAPINQEALQEKWAPLLDADGQSKISDPHRRMVTAVLLENQEQALREEKEFLYEQPTNSTGSSGTTAGFSASSTGAMQGFDPVLISLIRRSMPNLVAYDLAGVQPMNGPTGLIFAMRSRFTSNTGTEAFFDEADTTFSSGDKNATVGELGSGYAGNIGAGTTTGSNVGFGTITQAGDNPAALLPGATADNAETYNLSLIHI